MIRSFSTVLMLALLAACASAPPPPAAAQGRARLGETVRVGPLRVSPLHLVEDSRCPPSVACIWAGRVRIDARVDGRQRELTLAEPVRLGRGTLTLVEVQPERRAEGVIAAADYRFRFRFEPER